MVALSRSQNDFWEIVDGMEIMSSGELRQSCVVFNELVPSIDSVAFGRKKITLLML